MAPESSRGPGRPRKESEPLHTAQEINKIHPISYLNKLLEKKRPAEDAELSKTFTEDTVKRFLPAIKHTRVLEETLSDAQEKQRLDQAKREHMRELRASQKGQREERNSHVMIDLTGNDNHQSDSPLARQRPKRASTLNIDYSALDKGVDPSIGSFGSTRRASTSKGKNAIVIDSDYESNELERGDSLTPFSSTPFPAHGRLPTGHHAVAAKQPRGGGSSAFDTDLFNSNKPAQQSTFSSGGRESTGSRTSAAPLNMRSLRHLGPICLPCRKEKKGCDRGGGNNKTCSQCIAKDRTDRCIYPDRRVSGSSTVNPEGCEDHVDEKMAIAGAAGSGVDSDTMESAYTCLCDEPFRSCPIHVGSRWALSGDNPFSVAGPLSLRNTNGRYGSAAAYGQDGTSSDHMMLDDLRSVSPHALFRSLQMPFHSGNTSYTYGPNPVPTLSTPGEGFGERVLRRPSRFSEPDNAPVYGDVNMDADPMGPATTGFGEIALGTPRDTMFDSTRLPAPRMQTRNGSTRNGSSSNETASDIGATEGRRRSTRSSKPTRKVSEASMVPRHDQDGGDDDDDVEDDDDEDDDDEKERRRRHEAFMKQAAGERSSARCRRCANLKMTCDKQRPTCSHCARATEPYCIYYEGEPGSGNLACHACRIDHTSISCDNRRPCNHCQTKGRKCMYDGDDPDEDADQIRKHDFLDNMNKSKEGKLAKQRSGKKRKGSRATQTDETTDGAASGEQDAEQPKKKKQKTTYSDKKTDSYDGEQGDLVVQTSAPDKAKKKAPPTFHWRGAAKSSPTFRNTVATPARLDREGPVILHLTLDIAGQPLKGAKATTFLEELSESTQTYLSTAIAENVSHRSITSKDKRDFWTNKMVGEVLRAAHFPVTNLNSNAPPREIRLWIGDKSQARDTFTPGPGTDVERLVPRLIRGDFDFPFSAEKISPISQFLNEFSDDMIVQVQDLTRPVSTTSVLDVKIDRFRQRMAVDGYHKNPYNALDLPIRPGPPSDAVPAFIKRNPNASFLMDLDNHIRAHASEKDMAIASRSVAKPRRDHIKPLYDKLHIALCAEGGSITGPHQDAFGYETVVSVMEGRVLWCYLDPVDATSSQLQSVFDSIQSGNDLPRDLPWKAVVLEPGFSFTMASGTVHAVVRLRKEKTLLFAAHFLRRSELLRWVDTLKMQVCCGHSHNEDSEKGVKELVKVAREVLVKAKDNNGGGLKASDFGGKARVEEVLGKMDELEELMKGKKAKRRAK
ncbi:Transcriptional activator protein UGA3 [Sphaceloma murrayae]|uniref:Transcriptional activator protein UGA3 n=1 Tax=Sphaceloma murrayae TaxID=2082308 RepID=A0A2K1QIX1_9PEZI|nr:Transcriptional activator protein UGA3 [Sphaceloma murrayae]